MDSRLRTKDLKPFRDRLVEEQGWTCPVCKTPLCTQDAVLDHDHDTGRIRAALHRQCNQVEGRVRSWATRTGKGVPYPALLQGILDHITQDYSDMPFHPSHLTEKEYAVKLLRKKLKRLKDPRAIERTGLQIQALLMQEDSL